jgi:hypothetical protein
VWHTPCINKTDKHARHIQGRCYEHTDWHRQGRAGRAAHPLHHQDRAACFDTYMAAATNTVWWRLILQPRAAAGLLFWSAHLLHVLAVQLGQLQCFAGLLGRQAPSKPHSAG